MSNPYFRFKQFVIYQDNCAMKVGTDGVLLGAWTNVTGARQILDVGTGTGLISLQLAQRNPYAHITAVEIDEPAAVQATENINRSNWKNRMEVICCHFKDYFPKVKYDVIVSNPPYFMNDLKCPDSRRNTARHAQDLSYDLLFRHSSHLLAPQGTVSIIVPAELASIAIDTAWSHELHLFRRTNVYTSPKKKCKRVLMSFKSLQGPCTIDNLYIETENHEYTDNYIALTRDFYLKM